MIQFETLETERLILKILTPDMITHLFENYSDAVIMKHLGLTNEEELIKEREKSEGGYKTYDRSILSFLLVLKSNDETIGRGGFHNWYKIHRKAELGYALNDGAHKRNGYMTEAVTAILAYGFGTLNLNRVEACVGPDNKASLSIIKKNRFTQEGHLRQHYIRDGVIQDSLVFSLLKEEYEV